VVEKRPAVTAALNAVNQLSEAEVRDIEERRAKLVVLSSGQQVVEKRPAVTAALNAVKQLSETEIRDIEERRAKIAFLPKGAKIDYAFDPAAVATQLVRLADVADMVAFLDSDSRLGPPNLKKVAGTLSIVVPPTMKAKADIQLHLAHSIVRDRGRSTIR
jgi:hypothetical protein